MNRLRHAPLTCILILINTAFFLAEELYEHFYSSSLVPEMALTKSGLIGGDWWQLISYAFLHGNMLHLGVNMVALLFTGPVMEELLGGACYLSLFFGGAIAGGLLQTLASHNDVPLIGASAGICALLVGFATLLPRLQITALIFFIIPVKMKAATLGWLVIIGSLFCWYFTPFLYLHFGVGQGIGHLAHLGGGIAGFLLCRVFISCRLIRPLEFVTPTVPE
jgi:membrane associated rhomboid family serine protease